MMKVLHVLKSDPDETTSQLMAAFSEDDEVQCFELFPEDVDYDKLIKLVFMSDKVICWW